MCVFACKNEKTIYSSDGRAWSEKSDIFDIDWSPFKKWPSGGQQLHCSTYGAQFVFINDGLSMATRSLFELI